LGKKIKKPTTGRTLWLPLPSHIGDAAGVARKIWACWLSSGTKKEIASGVPRGRLLFALPTQATSDAMFGRILNWIKHFDTDNGAHSALLAHWKANFKECAKI
jgi:hypothetical protein